ncbi:hypothetical protein [Nocardia aurantiaca]|uniref:Uncharacterized protein n=1 Tax=Nocardia aurantiaca TaxID=2675850 RepID=A0A6I3KUZ6_9NOCA|nr:hypothetical protein [Nocardia aurantiaca]MTE14633.1 hypothetical protein [Nocardia aurantiaca]
MQLTSLNMHIAGLSRCRRDPGVMNVEQAHAAMQLHLDCTVQTCKVRRRARATLVAEGRCVLDERALP